MTTDWSLTEDGPPSTGSAAIVFPMVTDSGVPAALKLGWPHPEAEHEHLALRAWAGNGAVRLLRADPRRSVLLLERAHGGRNLGRLPVREACEVVARLYGRIHRPAVPQLARLSTMSGEWAERLAHLRNDRRVPRRQVEQAASLARAFATDDGTDGILLHTDLHYENVLAADREPWLVIDPKPLSGDPAYEVAPLLWNRWDEVVASPTPRHAILDRLYTVLEITGWDEDRVRDWVIVREMVNVLEALTVRDSGSRAGGTELDEWITSSVTVVKAMQR
ncbi:aminoglycoside phosphotransferase family protein [Planctomonas psychrotolerans]|uniref:aminoglycoside phosphotransferase family protein n=1 Tax=Planctomonas psychrotolerans TaxID=2528712 RepID=UPI001D0D6CB4|nr:aminoglycoside phosphotransferase family protein [Planctomonas psychrotolerans]